MCRLVLLLPVSDLVLFLVSPLAVALPLYLIVLALSLLLYFKILRAFAGRWRPVRRQ